MEEKIVNEQVSLENASPEAIAEKIAEILDAKKGRDIKVLPITDRTDIADYFVIASGTSNTHIRTLADEV